MLGIRSNIVCCIIAAVLIQYVVATSAAGAAFNKRVYIIIGSTGSKAAYSALEAAGVWMHPDTDRALNSRIYQQQVLQRLTVGLPANHTCFNHSAPDWFARNAPSDLYNRITPADMLANITAWHREMAHEMALSVPQNVTAWGWKHPYALYTLSFLYQVFPNAHIIHQVQDGRDYALNNWLRRSSRTTNIFERHFVSFLTGRNFSADETGSVAYSHAAGQTWALANHRALRVAGQKATAARGSHSVVRLEDLCSLRRSYDAVQAMLQHAGLPHSTAVVDSAVARIQEGRCHTGFWKVAWPSSDTALADAVRRIDTNISAALEAFGYHPRITLELPAWLDARPVMSRLTAAATAAAGPDRHPVILTFVSNGYERVVSNWLTWLQYSKVDTSHVLIVAREDCFQAVQAVVAGTGAAVFSLPVLSPNGVSHLDEAGRTADKWKNTRSGIWLERVRAMYELTRQGLPVLLTDLDAIWVKDPLPYMLAAGREQPQGYDLIVSRGYFPSEVYKTFKVAACMGFVHVNATRPAVVFVRSLLREKLRQLQLSSVRYYNDQRHMNQVLVEANLAYNVTVSNKALAQRPDAIIRAWGVATAPTTLSVLFMPESMVQRTCDNNTTNPDALVVHCQSPKSGAEKEAFLKQLKLWRQVTPHDMEGTAVHGQQ